ncbi:MAG: flavohemoglobin expression-modulating QEGLA motif protein [Acidobacteria bacterium]|nr:flavohemoglobin expression-modulating QEGLA motif protein [Acidobacteriota bacterium]
MADRGSAKTPTDSRAAAEGAGAGLTLGVDLDLILQRMAQGKLVRRNLQPWGRFHHDRSTPYLCVYRRPAAGAAPRAEELVTGEARYLTAPGDEASAPGVAAMVEAVVRAGIREFGAFLLVEISTPQRESPSGDPPPLFRIVRPRSWPDSHTVDLLESRLAKLDLPDIPVHVDVAARADYAPPGLRPLLRRKEATRNCLTLHVEVRPVYYSPGKKRVYPLLHRKIRDGLSRALQRAAFEFTQRHTTQKPPHFHALGRHTFVKLVYEVDSQLANVSNSFDPLLLTTPRNAAEAWSEFRRKRFQRAPKFSYRPVPIDPALVKRELFKIPIERIEDPSMAELFREQQDELDRKVTMITDRETPRFLQESLQLYGEVDDDLLRLALQLLDRIPSRSREREGGSLTTAEFATLAQKELSFLRSRFPGLRAKVEVRSDIIGLMVSRGNLLIGKDMKVPKHRAEALLQHEVGTHVVTYYNGEAQRLRQLRNGLPSYDELQEGIAVLAEYLVGGLSRARLRLLAARVLAVARMTQGASFVEVFRLLDRNWDFSQQTAFTVTMRVFRGGGQAKDAVYLRGLAALLRYLREGGLLEPLLVGKIGLRHLPLIEELKWRKLLVPPPLRPRYLDQPTARERLAKVGQGMEVMELVG